MKRQTTYVAFRYTLKDAFCDYVRPHLSDEEANRIFTLLCARLKTVDVTDLSHKYEESEIY